jgi:threonine synthase
MYSLADANIFNIALAGVFDDCQDLVKAVAADLEFKRRHAIGSVNSINWVRIMAQVVYYFRGYFAATATARQTATAAGPVRVSFCVPSGNFGNLLAGWIARKMGLPIARLVLATNENNVLDEFFRTGRYRVRGAADTWATSSPSMDISKASNFERFIFDLVGRNPQAVRELWGELDARGAFDLGATPFWPKVQACDVVSGTSRHADRLATIRQVYEATGRIVDPHTADGIKVAREYCRRGEPMICLETAQPAKFAETIVEAIGRLPPRPAALDGLEQLPQRCEPMPIDLGRLKAYLAAHAR